MNMPATLYTVRKGLVVRGFASCLFFGAISIASSVLQQGEFVPKKTETLHNPAAIAALLEQTEVPNLITHRVKDAQSLLQASKLLMGQPQFVASQRPPGTVVRQYPEARSKIKIGATVLVWVSAELPTWQGAPARQPNQGSVPATRLVPVPPLIHHRKEDAIQMLKLVGLQTSSAGIQEMPSQEETGIVLSQDPTAETMVRQGTSVSFTVSRQIERKLILRAFPASIRPGESVTLTAELDPLLEGAEYQFSSGTGAPSAWSTHPQAQFTYFNDGDYQATAAARWSNGSVKSNPVHIVAHAIKYEVRLLPDPLDVKAGVTVSFRAEVSPEVERATYVYHYGDKVPNDTSSSPTAQHSYEKAGNYTAWVTVRIAETPAAAGAIHSHDFPSSPVRLTIEPLPQVQPHPTHSKVPYTIGAVLLISTVNYASW